MSTTTTAAVLGHLGQPLVIHHDVEVDGPRQGEVTVRVLAAGVCHSDLSMQSGIIPACLPVVLGHEATGVVEEVGPGVERLVPGDHVVLSWVPQCGECWYCQRGEPHLCEVAELVMATGSLPDGTARFRLGGQPLFQMLGTGAFSTRTVISETAAVKIPADLGAAEAALLSCSVLTGIGAVLNTAGVQAGQTVAIVGCGGVGLNIVQGARIAGAGPIIAVDVSAEKLGLACELGATHAVDASSRDPVSAVMGLTGERGADVAFEAVGVLSTIEQCIAMTRRGGQAVLVGIPAFDVVLSLPAMQAVVMQARTIKGCWFGSSDIRRDVPLLVEHYRAGRLLLQPLISERMALEDVNVALEYLRQGRATRTVLMC